MWMSSVVGYTYRADMFDPACMVEVLIREGRLSPGARGMSAEEALDQLAEVESVDRRDESTFDSDEFPKVALGVFRHEGDVCGACCLEIEF